MKKLLFWMAGCLWTGIAPASRLAQGDTLVVVSPDSVIVSDRKDHIEIEVYGEHHNPNYRYRKVIEQNSNTATVVSQKKIVRTGIFKYLFPRICLKSNRTNGGKCLSGASESALSMHSMPRPT